MNELQKYVPITRGVKWLLDELNIHSPYGQNALRNLKPFQKKNLIDLQKNFARLSLVLDKLAANSSAFTAISSIFKKFRNIKGSLKSLISESVLLDECEFLEIKGFALLIEQLAEEYKNLSLNIDEIYFEDLTKLIQLLNPDKTIVRSFYVHESYSDYLKEIRNAKRLVEKKFLTEKDPDKKQQLKEERLKLVHQEKEEEREVRADLSRQLIPFLPALTHNCQKVGELEFLFAKAQLANRWDWCKPELIDDNSNNSLIAQNLINPEIFEILKANGKVFTPVSIELQQGVTLLTGANMGGKTISLMTVAMNAELVSLGFFPYATKFCSPLFDEICLVSGDGQDRSSGLSSFGAEIVSLNQLVQKTKTGATLAIFDEFARSTNPYEGKRFVKALCEFLQNSPSSYGLVATHYDGIELDGAIYYQVIGLKDKDLTVASEHDQKHVINNICEKMDYHLIRITGNYEVPKDALQIASLLKLDKDFIEILRKYY